MSEGTHPQLSPDAPAEFGPFVDLVERLHAEHTVAYHAAGDDKVYAYGGSGYLVILCQRVFDGLVELETPLGTARIEPDANGCVAVTSTTGETPLPELLADATRNLALYYQRRADVWKVKI